MEQRIESDSLGDMPVPAGAYYGAQTARSLQHFNIGQGAGGQGRMPFEVIHAYGTLKKAAAFANYELHLLTPEKKKLISQAANEVATGALDAHFPLSIWQTGSGTQTNMNVNEVIANRAIELAGGERGSKFPIHPNDDVNLSQSSNDTFPTVMYLAASKSLIFRLIPAVQHLERSLSAKTEAFRTLVKVGRTHLMDAVPITLGQEFSGYTFQIQQNLQRLQDSLSGLYQLPIGGTAVGTGLNAPPDFAPLVVKFLVEEMGIPFVCAPNRFALIAAHDALVWAHATIKTLACSLIKLATDLSWMGSGPRCGLGELFFPENEPGSSIMPGKINPTQCEALTMVCVHIMGNDQAIAIAGARGNFELNVFKPLLIHHFLNSVSLLTDALVSFDTYFLQGIQPNHERIASHVGRSLMLATVLSPHIGYDRAAQVVHKAFYENMTLKEACVQLGWLTEADFDRLVRPEEMI